MDNRIDTGPDSKDIIELATNPSRGHGMLMLFSASMLGLGMLTVPLELDLGRGRIAGNFAVANDGDASGEIEVMTLDQALGADLGSLLATPPGELNAALLDLLEDIIAANFPARARRQAELIARRLPDLVGLQEVCDLSCIDVGSPPPGEGCSHPSIAAAFVDHLEVTLDALAAEKVDYEAIAAVKNLDSTTATLTSNGDTIHSGGFHSRSTDFSCF